MIQLTRTLAIIGLFLLPIGLGLYFLGMPLVCWDACPQDVPAALLPVCARLLVPGMTVGVGAWVSGLVVIGRQRRWRALSAAFFVPAAAIGAGGLLLMVVSGAEYLEPAALAADLLIWSSLVLVALLAWLRSSPRLQPAR